MVERDSDLYRAIGGTSGCRKLSTALYARVQQDPLLRPLFPGKTMKCAIEEFAAFLSQFLGGPSEDTQRRWWLSLRESHLRFKIGPKERAAWMNNMAHALEDIAMEAPVQTALREFFERASSYLVNMGDVAPPAGNPAGSCQSAVDRELGRRWNVQRELDKTVAAIRNGNAETAIALAEGCVLKAYLHQNQSVLAGVLGVMIRSRSAAVMGFVQAQIIAVPGLVHERYAGRTLLHEASAQGSLTLVNLLLHMGSDANGTQSTGHPPLYSVANECSVPGGGSVVRALVGCGANVHFDGGVKRCTPLHMAARRGNVEVAEALLECGADLEARDSAGDTPLRRAINCKQPLVAALLVERGADIHSVGSKGLTAMQAARTPVMRAAIGPVRP